jgi:V8-like Glu-specific endopeptidase
VVHAWTRLALWSGLTAAFAASAAPAQASATDVVSRTFAETMAEVSAYWTPERIAAARPASELLAGLQPSAATGDLIGGGNRARRTAQAVPSPAKAPYRAHGKVLFSLGGTPYQCSATSVTAKTKRLVMTAGHCVFDAREGGFARNWMFIPGKSGSSEPYGRWTAKRLATTRQWAESTRNNSINDDDVRFDVGFATMQKRKGRRLQSVVGARRIAFNRSPGHFDAFGYPAQAPFDGSEPYVCSSPNLGRDTGPPPRPMTIDCDMTGGASGGSWISGHRITSVTSYSYEPSCTIIVCGPDPDGDRLYGPFLGETIQDLYRSQRRRR